ncbi:MAG: nucleotidyltransferase substrate binding protein [Dehalococcoidia bacterium]|nr:nucleotidyltransferase substrate binding protein [Dehalococcoidia bacterium]
MTGTALPLVDAILYLIPLDVDLQTFQDALCRLEEAVLERGGDPANAYLRDAVLLRFYIALEASAAALGRYLDAVYFRPNARVLSPRQLFRHAARPGLISDCEAWLRPVENRNRIVHAYSEPMADAIAANAAAFAADARALLNALEQGIADGG